MMWIWVLVVIVLIAVLIPFFNRSRRAETQPPTSSGSGKSSLKILEERYARDEIDREEFEQKRRDLQR